MSRGQGGFCQPSPSRAALVRLVRVVKAVRTKTAWRNAFRLPVPSLLMRSPAWSSGGSALSGAALTSTSQEEARDKIRASLPVGEYRRTRPPIKLKPVAVYGVPVF